MPGVADELRRAYALLDLAPGASFERVRQQYKALVKRWHPDRYAGDPVNQAEAASRMRQINGAYETLARALAPDDTEVEGEAAGPPARPPERQRLSREEIERIVEGIESQESGKGVMGRDEILDRYPVLWYLAFATFIGYLIPFAVAAWSGDYGLVWREKGFLLLIVACIVMLVVGKIRRRSRNR